MILIVVEADPPVLLAHIVYVVWVRFTLGVPEITPFVKVRPVGMVGLISQVAAKPPEIDGVMSIMLVPRVKTTTDGE